MNNKDKARELSKKFARQYHANTWPEWSNDESFHFSNEEIYNGCLEMAVWKEQQMIQKAVEWLEEHTTEYASFDDDRKADWENKMNFIEDFKKYMEN